MMAILLYVLVLTLTLVVSPVMAQLPQDAAVVAAEALADRVVQGDFMDWFLLMSQAKQGDVNALFTLGLIFHKHVQEGPQYTEAAQWYRQAAELGHAEAQFTLSGMYYYGRGVSQDYAESAQWARRAAEQRHAKAQGALGALYAEGHGVPQNYTEAV